MNEVESINLIFRNPEVRSGRPCIVGTGLRVIDIVMAMQFGDRSPDQMAGDYQLSLGQVYAALAYYYENKEEIDEDIREDVRLGRELAKDGWGKPENSLFPAGDSVDVKDRLRRAIEKAIDESGFYLNYDLLRELGIRDLESFSAWLKPTSHETDRPNDTILS